MMNTRKMKILKRGEQEDCAEQEAKRPRTPDREEAPITTVPAVFEPKSPPYSPAWGDPVRPLDILGGQYPDPQSMDLSITKSKTIGEQDFNKIYFIGIRHGHGARPWSMSIQSPPCHVKFDPTKFETYDNIRVLLQPSIPDGSFLAYPAEFMAFVDHVETLGERLKTDLMEQGEDVSKWRLPAKYKDGICEGIYAKLKNATVKELVRAEPNRLRCVLKLTCVYANQNQSGMSFELTAVYPDTL
jgi:hypothetical protein